MAGHAQLKFVITECSKTQIRLTGPMLCLQTVTTVLYRDQGGLGFSIAGGRGSVPYKGNDNVSCVPDLVMMLAVWQTNTNNKFETCYEIMALFILCKRILQTRMRSQITYVWSDPSSTCILHVCEQRRLW